MIWVGWGIGCISLVLRLGGAIYMRVLADAKTRGGDYGILFLNFEISIKY